MGLSLILTGSISFASEHPGLKKFQTMKNPSVPLAVFGSNAQAKLGTGVSQTKAKLVPTKASVQTSAEVPAAQAYGFLVGPDGTDWYYTQNYQFDESGYYYTAAEVTIFNDKNEKQGTFTVNIPEDKTVNQIEPFGFVTKKFFDRDDKSLEVMVNLHVPGTPEYQYMNDSYVTSVYHIGGEKVIEYPHFSIMLSASLNSYETYQRMLLVHTEQGQTLVDVYAAAGYGETEPQVEHTFKIQSDLLDYSDGSYMNFYVLDSKPYYILSHYEKPWTEGYDPATYEPIVTPDNHYVVESFDKNFRRVDSVTFALDVPENRLYRFASFGTLSDRDLSANFFDETGKLNYVISYEDYDIATDDYVFSFYVADSEGQIIKTIADNVVSAWGTLKSLPGFSEQMYFMQAIGDVQQIQMVDIPSCTNATLMPAQIDGERISTNFDRYLVGDDYQYIMSMGSATSDEEGNVIARLGWYTRDLKLDHYTSFNLGKRAELFRPLIKGYVLNPYLFDTDNDLDFIFFAKIKKENSEEIEDVLMVCHEDGTVMRTFRADEVKGDLRTASVLTEDSNNPRVMLVSYNYDTKVYSLEFHSLPFSMFAKGGEGTKASPYVISTTGDLQMVGRNPNAYYVLGNDIDLSLAADNWTPVSTFGGHLDGQNHSISNLRVNSEMPQAGLFGYLTEGSSIKDLKILKADITVNGKNSNVGVIAGMSVRDTLTNVHVYDARIIDESGNASSTIGGLVGYGSVFTEIQGCSVQGATITAPSASAIGGIVGDARTSTNVTACALTGGNVISGDTYVGGIMGVSGTDSKVTDCHVQAQLSGTNTVGGIVGSNNNRAAITRCLAQGSIQVAKASTWGKLSAGGILGYIESDWTQKAVTVLSKCVSDMAMTSQTANDGTVNRIVGFTIADERYEPGEKHYTEIGLAMNYATENALVNGEAVNSDDHSVPNGASKTVAELDKDFMYATMGYVYGTTTTEPWKENGTLLPQLWFENVAVAIECEKELMEMVEGDTLTNQVIVYGLDAAAVTVESTDEQVAKVKVVETEGNRALLQVACVGEGAATIIVKAGELVASFDVIAVATGISQISGNNGNQLSFVRQGTALSAEGAQRMTLYSINGCQMESVKGDTIEMNRLQRGTYIVVATAKDGSRQIMKLQY